MATWATVKDVATRLNITFTAAETAQAEALLSDVMGIMRLRLPQLEQWVDSGRLDVDGVRGVTCELAMRAITVADTGVGTGQVTHPEHTVLITSAAQAGIDLSDRQIELLTPTGSSADEIRGKAFSIHPG
jgi:hypothetical protein